MTKRGYYGMNRQKSTVATKELSVDWRHYFTDKEEEAQARRLLTSLRIMGPEYFRIYWQRQKPKDRKYLQEIMAVVSNLEASESLEEFSRHVKTKDEHKQGDESVRPFPARNEKAYIWDILDTFLKEKIVAIEKSRQLMVTWLCCMYALWMAKYQKNRLIFIQSRKEENAANLIYNSDVMQARISFMEANLPKELQSKYTPSYGKMFFHETGSVIQGIPEGGDQIRQYVPSLLISDEAAFQPEFEAAWRAAKPCLDGGGQAIIVSTAKNGSFMKALLKVA